PVIDWSERGIGETIKKVENYITYGVARTSYLFFIDEGNAFIDKPLFQNIHWKSWKMKNIKFDKISVLWMKLKM
ncbi:unnamed protein product, partial [marine sediment metagenome]